LSSSFQNPYCRFQPDSGRMQASAESFASILSTTSFAGSGGLEQAARPRRRGEHPWQDGEAVTAAVGSQLPFFLDGRAGHGVPGRFGPQ
jgi:hypothetical protein